MSQAINPDMRPKGKVLSRSVRTNDLIVDTSSDSQRKRQFVDGEGFIHPPKSMTAKVRKRSDIQNPTSTSNAHETLAGEKAIAEPNGVSGNVHSVPDLRSGTMPPIVAKLKGEDRTTVNSIKAQTSGQISFEYAANGLKLRTSNAADH